ncbi:hypothetical protein V8D89_010225 [Ganoderma adspersum]
MYCPPRITTVKRVRLPAPPKGWMYTPVGTLGDYPVLFFGPYTYTALSNVDNGYTMQIAAWDVEKKLVGQWTKTGARYLQQISYNAGTQTVTFTGEANGSVSATLDELVVGPRVSGPFSFWPVSYADGRDSFCIVVVDQDNVIRTLIECPGSHNIDKVVVDDAKRTIELFGKNNAAAQFDYNIALTCFTCAHTYTKDDFIFLSEYFKVLPTDAQVSALASSMPMVDCSLCYRIEDLIRVTISELSFLQRVEGYAPGAGNPDVWEHVEGSGTKVGYLLGAAAGSFGGFFIGGPKGASTGFNAGSAAGAAIGQDLIPGGDTDEYQPSPLEQQFSLVGYDKFPCKEFIKTPVTDTVFKSSFPRYGSLLYAAAVAKVGPTPSPQAYLPSTQRVEELPRDPRYKAQKLTNGVEVTKYIFVIIQTNKSVGNAPPLRGYQMRINPEDFLPDMCVANQSVNHSQLSEAFHFWALVGGPHTSSTQVYAAGALYVDITNNMLLGIDIRTGHFFRWFTDPKQVPTDKEMNDATFEFLGKLGYDTSSMKNHVDIMGYFQENPVVG